jgi:hypothetical protein
MGHWDWFYQEMPGSSPSQKKCGVHGPEMPFWNFDDRDSYISNVGYNEN